MMSSELLCLVERHSDMYMGSSARREYGLTALLNSDTKKSYPYQGALQNAQTKHYHPFTMLSVLTATRFF